MASVHGERRRLGLGVWIVRRAACFPASASRRDSKGNGRILDKVWLVLHRLQPDLGIVEPEDRHGGPPWRVGYGIRLRAAAGPSDSAPYEKLALEVEPDCGRGRRNRCRYLSDAG